MFRYAGMCIRLRVLWVAAALATSAIKPVQAAAINTGVESLLWPLVIVAAPVVLVHRLIYGSDEGAREDAEKKANALLQGYTRPIATTGLYAPALNFQRALYGLLLEQRLPVVEVNTAGARWLLELTKSPDAYFDMAAKHPYIRVKLGPSGSPECIVWAKSSDDFTASPPVRPGTCMQLQFVDELQSNVQLELDASQVSHRELKWILSSRESGQPILAVPFWQSQTEGQPVQASVDYRPGWRSSTFVRVVNKLTPVLEPGQAKPYVLAHEGERTKQKEFSTGQKVPGEFRVLTLNWPVVPDDNALKETWEQAYARAQAAGKPIVWANKWVIDPQRHAFTAACGFPYGKGCEYARQHAFDWGVLSVNWVEAFRSDLIREQGKPIERNMMVKLGARDYSGQALWYAFVEPKSLPVGLEMCADLNEGCYFYVKQIAWMEQELVMRGVFWSKKGMGRQIPKTEFELVAPTVNLISPTKVP